MGLRLGEGVNLTVGDIDSESMRVHIRDAKGNKDRLVPLPKSTLHVLKNFWSVHRHPLFIFPSRKRGVKNTRLVDRPLDRSGIQTAMKAVVKQIGVKKKFHATPFDTALQPICSKRVLISLNCKKSSAMSAF